MGCCAWIDLGCEGGRDGRSFSLGHGGEANPLAPPLPPSLIFGLITCLTGVLGVGLGVEISRRLRRSNPRADPLVCAAGLLGSSPFLFLSLACARGSIVATYVSSQQVSKGVFWVQVGGMVHWGRTRVRANSGVGMPGFESQLWPFLAV